MNGTTPPCEMTTSPRSLFSLHIPSGQTPSNKDRMFAQYALLIVPNGQLQVARNDTLFLVVARSVTRELENLGRKVLEDSSEVH